MRITSTTPKCLLCCLLLVSLLPLEATAQLGSGEEEANNGPLITFLQKPEGIVQNPVYFEFYASEKVDHYEMKGKMNGTSYKDWTKLDVKIDNENNKFLGYVAKHQIRDAEPGTESAVYFRACPLTGGPGLPLSGCGASTEEISWEIEATTVFTEPQIDLLNIRDSNGNEYPFSDDENSLSKVSSVLDLNLSLDVAPSSGAEISENDIKITAIDGQDLLADSAIRFSCIDGESGWRNCESIDAFTLPSTYRNHSLTIEVRDSAGETAFLSAPIEYYAPLHMEVKTSTDYLGSLTPTQAQLDPPTPINQSLINYDITLSATAVQGMLAKYELLPEGTTRSSRIENFQELGYEEGVWLPSRSAVLNGIFHLPSSENTKSYKASWVGRLKLPSECKLTLSAETGAGDDLEILLDQQAMIQVKGTQRDKTYHDTLSPNPVLTADIWYPLEVSYLAHYKDGAADDDKLILSYNCAKEETYFTPANLGTPLLGAGEYIAPHLFEIVLSPEQIVNNSQPMTVTVTPAQSGEEYLVPATLSNIIDPSKPEEHQIIKVSLAAEIATGLQQGIEKEFSTTLKVGDDFKISFPVVTSRAFEYANITPGSFEGSHHEIYSLLSLVPDSDNDLVDKDFKGYPGAPLTVTENAPLTGDVLPHNLYYQVVVGPQLDTLTKHCSKAGGACGDQFDASYWSPLSVRPRSLFGAQIPDLYIDKDFIASQGTYFQDPETQYAELNGSFEKYKIRDNNGEIPSANTTLRIRNFSSDEISALQAAWTGTGLTTDTLALPISLKNPINGVCSVELVDYLTTGNPASMLSLYSNNYPLLETGELVKRGDTVLVQLFDNPLNFHFTDQGTIAFGLNPADTQIACDPLADEHDTCATLWVAADMLVPGLNGEVNEVSLDPFKIHYRLSAQSPLLNPGSTVAQVPEICTGELPVSTFQVE